MSDESSRGSLPVIYVPKSRFTDRTNAIWPVALTFVRAGVIYMIEWETLKYIEHTPFFVDLATVSIALLILAVIESRDWLAFKSRYYFPVTLTTLVILWIGVNCVAYIYYRVPTEAVQSPASVVQIPPPATPGPSTPHYMADEIEAMLKVLLPIKRTIDEELNNQIPQLADYSLNPPQVMINRMGMPMQNLPPPPTLSQTADKIKQGKQILQQQQHNYLNDQGLHKLPDPPVKLQKLFAMPMQAQQAIDAFSHLEDVMRQLDKCGCTGEAQSIFMRDSIVNARNYYAAYIAFKLEQQKEIDADIATLRTLH